VEIIGHRGASFDAPENTLASVHLAWAQGADAVEIDVHLSLDGRLVAIHDANTRRTTRVNRKVARQTLAQLRALDAGRWKAPRWAGEKIPTLEEVLGTIPPGQRLFVEIKSRADAAPELAAAKRRGSAAPLSQRHQLGIPTVSSVLNPDARLHRQSITDIIRSYLARVLTPEMGCA